jgi:hypothetical protein
MKPYVIEVVENQVSQVISCEESEEGAAHAESTFSKLASDNGCPNVDLAAALADGFWETSDGAYSVNLHWS